MAANEYYMHPDELYSQELSSWDNEPKTPPKLDAEETPDRASPPVDTDPAPTIPDSPHPQNLTPPAASCCSCTPPAPELPHAEVRNPSSCFLIFPSFGGKFFVSPQEKPKKDKFTPAILNPALASASPPIPIPLKENKKLLNASPEAEPRKRKQQF